MKKFRPPSDDLGSVVFLLGFYRLLIGAFFGGAVGLALFVVASGLTRGGGNVLVYFGIYLPVRWIEWKIMSVIIIREAYHPNRWPIGLSKDDNLWRLGGIGVSFLADIPVLIAASGFSVGRVLC